MIIANELLDNLPFRLAVFDEGWREAFVDVDRAGRFVELLSAPVRSDSGRAPVDRPLGARAPLQSTRVGWVDDARARLRSGSLLVIDYGVPRTGGTGDTSVA